jgi:hypothetical protein
MIIKGWEFYLRQNGDELTERQATIGNRSAAAIQVLTWITLAAMLSSQLTVPWGVIF